MTLPLARRPGLPGAARSHSAVSVRPLVSASEASHVSETDPDVPKTASPVSHGRKPYLAVSWPETESPAFVASGVKVTPDGVLDLTSTVVLPTL